MQKNLTQLEYKVAEKVYHFICDPDSPLDHVKESLFQFIKYVGAVEDAIRAQQAQTAKTDIQPAEPEVKHEAA